MAYTKNSIIVRPRATGLSGIMDDIKGIATGALDFYGKAKQDAGAAAALQQQQVAAQAIPVSPGIDTGTLLMIGGIGIAAILLLKKKKS